MAIRQHIEWLLLLRLAGYMGAIAVIVAAMQADGHEVDSQIGFSHPRRGYCFDGVSVLPEGISACPPQSLDRLLLK